MHQLVIRSLIIGLLGLTGSRLPAQSIWRTETPSDLNEPRPIDRHDTLWLEEMTWMELRDAVAEGKDRILLPTGGIEQSGPYLALGKHNYILRQTTEALARRMGRTLIAPIVSFVPEGSHVPPSHHLRYPGTIGVRIDTFEALLEDVALSLKNSGFKSILLLGDSGDNQQPMRRVAEKLNTAWPAVKVLYVPEYYQAGTHLAGPWLKAAGYEEVEDGYHDRLRHTAILMTLDPALVRLDQRIPSQRASVNGISLLPRETLIALGWKLIDFEVTHTLEALHQIHGLAN